MAKKSYVLVRLMSSEGTGYFKVKRKNTRATYKLSLRKYDPKLCKHVLFTEKKI